jgi:nucleotide-binding universal stress UspA family protein
MYTNILLPIDLNSIDTQEAAVGTAVQLAQTFGARLHLMAVVPSLGVGVVSTFFPEDYEQKVTAAAEARS